LKEDPVTADRRSVSQKQIDAGDRESRNQQQKRAVTTIHAAAATRSRVIERLLIVNVRRELVKSSSDMQLATRPNAKGQQVPPAARVFIKLSHAFCRNS
jgi:hypothetical protein